MPQVAPHSRVQDFQYIDCVVMTALRAEEELAVLWKGREVRPTHTETRDCLGIQQLQFDRLDLVCARQWSPQTCSEMLFTETVQPGRAPLC